MFGRRDNEAAVAVLPAENGLQRAFALIEPLIAARIEPHAARRMARRVLAQDIRTICEQTLEREGIALNRLEARDLITRLIQGVLDDSTHPPTADPVPETDPAPAQPLELVPEPDPA